MKLFVIFLVTIVLLGNRVHGASIAQSLENEDDNSKSPPTFFESQRTTEMETKMKSEALPLVSNGDTDLISSSPQVLATLDSEQLSTTVAKIQQILKQHLTQISSHPTTLSFLNEFAIKLATLTDPNEIHPLTATLTDFTITNETPLFITAIGGKSNGEVKNIFDKIYWKKNSTTDNNESINTELGTKDVQLYKMLLTMAIMESANYFLQAAQKVTIKMVKITNSEQFSYIDSVLQNIEMSTKSPAMLVLLGKRSKPKNLSLDWLITLFPDLNKSSSGNRRRRHIVCDHDDDDETHNHDDMTDEEKLKHGCQQDDHHERKRRNSSPQEKMNGLEEKWNRITLEIRELINFMMKSKSMIVSDMDHVISQKLQFIPAQVEEERRLKNSVKNSPVAEGVPVTDILIENGAQVQTQNNVVSNEEKIVLPGSSTATQPADAETSQQGINGTLEDQPTKVNGPTKPETQKVSSAHQDSDAVVTSNGNEIVNNKTERPDSLELTTTAHVTTNVENELNSKINSEGGQTSQKTKEADSSGGNMMNQSAAQEANKINFVANNTFTHESTHSEQVFISASEENISLKETPSFTTTKTPVEITTLFPNSNDDEAAEKLSSIEENTTDSILKEANNNQEKEKERETENSNNNSTIVERFNSTTQASANSAILLVNENFSIVNLEEGMTENSITTNLPEESSTEKLPVNEDSESGEWHENQSLESLEDTKLDSVTEYVAPPIDFVITSGAESKSNVAETLQHGFLQPLYKPDSYVEYIIGDREQYRHYMQQGYA